MTINFGIIKLRDGSISLQTVRSEKYHSGNFLSTRSDTYTPKELDDLLKTLLEFKSKNAAHQDYVKGVTAAYTLNQEDYWNK